jgi:hypothetical protein
LAGALLPHRGLADAISTDQTFDNGNAAKLLRSDGSAMGNSE